MHEMLAAWGRRDRNKVRAALEQAVAYWSSYETER
jgi:hypothetical protein